MILGKKPHDRVIKRDAIFGVMQFFHKNFFRVGSVLVGGIFSDDIPCLNIFSRSSFGRKRS